MSEDHSPSAKGDIALSRTPPLAPVPALSLLIHRKHLLFDLEIQVVTPLFGGGAIAGVTDPDLPIRASGIRGQLRFWWRTCQGARFTSADELFKEEEQLWGSTDVPSKIAVTVEMLAKGRRVPAGVRTPKGFVPTTGWPGYALFPFQGKDDRGRVSAQPNEALVDARFHLRVISGPTPPDAKQLEQVRGALWAWLTFGGIGARTRRGCGSLFCAHPDFAPPLENLAAWLREQAGRYVAKPVAGHEALLIPRLYGARVVWGSSGAALPSWKKAVDIMQRFRQVPEGRPEGKVPGKSRWPEADSLRRIDSRADTRMNSFPALIWACQLSFTSSSQGPIPSRRI